MPNAMRYFYGFVSTFALAVGGVIYNEVFHGGLYDLAVNEHAGIFSQHVKTLDALVPVLLAGLLLVIWAWVLVGGAQEERARRRVR